MKGVITVGSGGGPALGQAKRSEEIDGTAANQWRPAQVTIKPGGTVTFWIAGGQTHPVGSGQAPPGTGGSTPPSASPHITKVGDACTVRFPKAGAYPFFCQVNGEWNYTITPSPSSH